MIPMSHYGRTPPIDRDWADEAEDERIDPKPGRSTGVPALTGGGLTLAALVVLALIWIAREPDRDKAHVRFHRSPAPLGSVAFAPDGRTLALGRADGGLVIEDLAGVAREIEAGHGSGMLARGLAYSPDGRTLASGGRGSDVTLWDVEAGSVRASLEGHARPVGALAFSPDGKWLASGSLDGLVKVWDLANGREITQIAGHSLDIRGLVFSPDGKTLATGSLDGSVKVWDLANGREIAGVNGGGRRVYGLAFAPDGRTLALGLGSSTADVKGEVVLWNPADARQPFRVLGPASFAAVAFSPDGRTLAAAGGDRVVKLWDVESGREIATLVGHEGTIASLAFSPDGRSLVTAGQDSLVGLFKLKPTEHHL
jgi:WD40 repeat protein